jgi:hypothetical protein
LEQQLKAVAEKEYSFQDSGKDPLVH